MLDYTGLLITRYYSELVKKTLVGWGTLHVPLWKPLNLAHPRWWSLYLRAVFEASSCLRKAYPTPRKTSEGFLVQPSVLENIPWKNQLLVARKFGRDDCRCHVRKVWHASSHFIHRTTCTPTDKRRRLVWNNRLCVVSWLWMCWIFVFPGARFFLMIGSLLVLQVAQVSVCKCRGKENKRFCCNRSRGRTLLPCLLCRYSTSSYRKS